MRRQYIGSFFFVLLLLFSVALSPAICLAEEDRTIEDSFQQRFQELATEAFAKQRLVQYGYFLFERPLTEFESIRHLPVGPDYALGPGDTLVIRIYGNFFADYEVEVDRDGKVTVPEVGPIEIWGLSFREARLALEEHVKSYYAGIRVSVTMGELRSIYVHIMGEVNRPGIHELGSLSTIIQALFSTRGPNRLGSLRDIRVLRDHTVISRFDLYDFLLEGRLEEDIRLQDNDVVYVATIGDLVAIGGEVKRPGIYESREGLRLSQLLELAGGLTPTAFLQNIKIERIKNNEERVLLEISIDDLDTFAGSEEDIYLKDSDLIFIDSIVTHRMPERQAFITISGNIGRPDDYQFFPEMTVKELMEEAGDILPETILHRGEIWRFISTKTRQIIPFDVEKALEDDPEENLELMEWDHVRIYADYDILPDEKVRVVGEVNEPGSFKFVEGMTLRDLLFRGHELTDDAYLKRADLFRYRQDELREVISVNLQEVITGEFDMELEKRDLLYVYSIKWVFPTQRVRIDGAVQEPDGYEYYQGMQLSDLIFLAGGLQKEAYLEAVEIYRPNFGVQEGPSVITVNIEGLQEAIHEVGSSAQDVLLQEGDRVYVRRHITDTTVRRVTMVGEVNLPGEYTLRQGERLSSIIERAGGLTFLAHPFGAVMTRESIKKEQQKFITDFVKYQRQKIEEERARLAQLSLTTVEREERKKALDHQENALDLMLARMPEGRIVFDLEGALQGEESPHDLILQHGDHLLIPPLPQVVMVTGEVYNPEALVYVAEQDYQFYLDQLGGVTSRGDEEEIYILKANGRVENQYTGFTPLKQGDIIVVPPQDL